MKRLAKYSATLTLLFLASLFFDWRASLPGGIQIRNKPPYYHQLAGRVMPWCLHVDRMPEEDNLACSLRWYHDWLPYPLIWGVTWSAPDAHGTRSGKVWTLYGN